MFFKDTIAVLKDFLFFVINYFFLLWAHSPILALTSDSQFTNLQFPINNKDVRLSFIALYFGEYVFYIFTLNFTDKKFRIIEKMSLSKLKQFNDDDDNGDFKSKLQDFKHHILTLSTEEINIEKESLERGITDQEARINKSDMKLNIYSAIVLAAISVVNINVLKFFTLKFSIRSILSVLSIYFFANIFIIIFQNIKVKGYNSSCFCDLILSTEKKQFYLEQLYYDFHFRKIKAALFVSYICRIYDYLKVLVFLIVLIIFLSLINKNQDIAINNESSYLITINKENLKDTYSYDSISLSEAFLKIQKKNFSGILVLSKIDIPVYIKGKLSMFDKQKIYYIFDESLNDSEIKIILVE